MTVLGNDISKYQYDTIQHKALPLHLLKDQGYLFTIARFSIGDTEDPLYNHFRMDAHLHHLAFGCYHYITTDTPMHVQAREFAKVGSTPAMVDAEAHGLTWCQIEQFIECCFALGMNLRSIYLPHWFWETIGQPNLNVGPASRLALVASNYGTNPHEYGSKAYPGDNSPRWFQYGGKHPTLLQFGSNIKIDHWGPGIDSMAYRGSVEQLKASGLVYFWRT